MINQTEAIYRFIAESTSSPTLNELHQHFGIPKTVIGESLRDLVRRKAIVNIPLDRNEGRAVWGYHKLGPAPRFRRPRGQAARFAMAALACGRSITSAEFAREANITLTYAAHTLDRLERKGLLTSVRDTTRKRSPRTYTMKPIRGG